MCASGLLLTSTGTYSESGSHLFGLLGPSLAVRNNTFLDGWWPLYEMKPEAAGTGYGDPPPLVTPPHWSCCTDHMVLGNDENAEGKKLCDVEPKRRLEAKKHFSEI